MRFEFATAGRVLFGTGCLAELGPAIRGWGSRGLVVRGRSSANAQPVFQALVKESVQPVSFPVVAEPTLQVVRDGVELGIKTAVRFVIGVGGGSVLDAAKAIAILLANRGDPLDYLEVIGKGQPFHRPSLPIVAIPTTSGSGSEATRNAVLLSPEHQVKASLRSPALLPRVTLVDPSLTLALSPEITATTGLDALTQLIEPFLSLKANAITDAFCREGMARSARSLVQAYQEGENLAAREDLSLASLLGGMALANAGLGAVHGLAAAIGGSFLAPHGAICARLLPLVLAANLEIARCQDKGETLPRFQEVAAILTGAPGADPEDGVHWLAEVVETLGVPKLASFGLTQAALPALAVQAMKASSMRANPVPLVREDLQAILALAL